MAFERMRIFTGNANPKLAEAVCTHLHTGLGRIIVGRFSDGEVMVELLENVRGRDIFILQSTSAPTNDHLMEILVMTDALKRASAGRITAAIPVPRLRAAGPPPALGAGADQRQGRRRHADHRRRQSRDDDGPARRPDPGLLQHPGRQHLRDADPAWATCGSRTTTTCSSSRPTWAASCAPAPSRSGSTPTSRSSTSAGRGRTTPR